MLPRSRTSRLLFVLVLAVGALTVPAAPAFAHAELLSNEPSGAHLDKVPDRAVLRFSEAVEIPLGSIRVYSSPDGKQIPTGAATHLSGESKAVTVPFPKLDRGGYVVTWRVTSADSHPVHGAFTFRVGASAGDDRDSALAARLLKTDGGSTVVGAVYAAIRFTAFTALVLLVGGLFFLTLVWSGGVAVAGVRRLLWGAWTAVVVATAIGIPIQGVYAAGLPLSQTVSSTVLSGMFGGRFGKVWAARLVLLVVMAAVLAVLGRRSEEDPDVSRTEEPKAPRTPALLAGCALGVALMITPGLAGHAATQDLVPLALFSDLIHLLSVSLWLGGLTFLVAYVLPRKRAGELAAVVPRFSRLAAWAVATILVTGTFQGWREVRSTAALTQTTYGRLLVVKFALFLLLVGLGALSRRWVHARYQVPAAQLSFGPGTATADPDEETVSRLRRSVGLETIVAVAVLAVTTLLVNAQPARSALGLPFSAEMRTDELLINVTVDPAKTGRAALHFYTLTPAGAVKEVEDMEATLRLPDQDIGPLKVPLQRAGPGHFSAYGQELPLRGRWQLEVTARLNEIDEVRATTTVPVK